MMPPFISFVNAVKLSLPSTARTIGQYYSKFRRAAESFKRQLMDMDYEMEREAEKARREAEAAMTIPDDPPEYTDDITRLQSDDPDYAVDSDPVGSGAPGDSGDSGEVGDVAGAGSEAPAEADDGDKPPQES